MRSLVNWKDMVCEFPNRFAQTVEGDKVTLQRSPGTVRTQGTPQNATNFNIMDLAALEAMLLSSEAMRMLLRQNEELKGITGEVIEATLTNSQVYPHNNSIKTLQIVTPRNTKDYTITVEVVSVTGGAAGEFEISDKLLNGFKIKYTGSASSVAVRCYVRGGI